jgi:hypothetical protein
MRNLHTTSNTQREFYLQALKNLELPPVHLDAIRVDRGGWSPEVADALCEQGYPRDYLRVGGVQFAIIVAPEQVSSPVLVPSHSFDSHCLRLLYEQNRAQIANLTERGSVVVTMARGLDEVSRARDLLRIDHVLVEVSDTSGLIDASKTQQEGERRIRAGHEAALDTGLAAALMQSIAQFGDLRGESIQIEPLRFTDVASFYTSGVAGGAWVFRGLPEAKPLVVVRQHEPGEKSGSQYVSIDTPEEGLAVLKKLTKAGFLNVPHGRHRENLPHVQSVRRAILAAAIREKRPDTKLAGISGIAWGRLASSLNGELPDVYHALDRYTASLGSSAEEELDEMVRDDGLLPWLAMPTDSVTSGTRAALGSLLAAIAPEDVLRQREYDRHAYRLSRKTWPKPYEEWVEEQISLAETKA